METRISIVYGNVSYPRKRIILSMVKAPQPSAYALRRGLIMLSSVFPLTTAPLLTLRQLVNISLINNA